MQSVLHFLFTFLDMFRSNTSGNLLSSAEDIYLIEAIPLCNNIYPLDILPSKTQLNIPTQWYNKIRLWLGYMFRPQRAIIRPVQNVP